MRTATFIFERMANLQECFWRSLKLRESATQHLQSIVRTAFQRIIEITMFRQSRDAKSGKQTHAQVFQEYKTHLPSATNPDVSSKEAITETLVGQVFVIYSKHFTDVVLAVVQKAEKRVGVLAWPVASSTQR